MILRPVRPGVALGPADHEPPGRVDVVLGLLIASSRPASSDLMICSKTLRPAASSVLDLLAACWVEITTIASNPLRLAVLVIDRHLALAVGAKPFDACSPLRTEREDSRWTSSMGELDRQRHQLPESRCSA